MTIDPTDPPRWSEAGAGAPPALSSLLRDARDDVPGSSDLDAMFARLTPNLSPQPAPGTAPRAPWGRLGKVLGVLGVLGAGVFGVRALSTPDDDTPAPPPPTASAPVISSPLPPAAPEARVEIEVTPPAAASAPPAPPSESKPRAAPKMGEAELLEAARRALATDPARALRLAEQHKARFPGGILQQEREVIAIDALRRLGRGNAATHRAEKFEDRFPDSAHRRGVESGQRKP